MTKHAIVGGKLRQIMSLTQTYARYIHIRSHHQTFSEKVERRFSTLIMIIKFWTKDGVYEGGLIVFDPNDLALGLYIKSLFIELLEVEQYDNIHTDVAVSFCAIFFHI